MLKVVMQGLAVGSEWWWSCESFKGPAKVHQTTSRPAGGSNTAEKLLGRVVLSSLVRELRGLRERTTSTQQLLTPPYHLNQSKVLVIITRQTVTRRFPLHLHLRAKLFYPPLWNSRRQRLITARTHSEEDAAEPASQHQQFSILRPLTPTE